MNLFYKCVSFLPLKLIFVAMKEVVRVRKIAAGVHHAHHRYHHGWFVMMAVGWVKGELRDIPNVAGRHPALWEGGENLGVKRKVTTSCLLPSRLVSGRGQLPSVSPVPQNAGLYGRTVVS